MKNVAAYDLDPVNGGLIKYAKGQTDPFQGVAVVPALDSTAEFFTGTMLDNAPEVNLYMEYSNKTCLDNVLRLFRDCPGGDLQLGGQRIRLDNQ